MTGRLPPVFDDLRDQLREAAARDIAIESEVESRVAARGRRGRRRQWLLVTLGALAAFGGVAVAERAIDRTGPDIAGDSFPRPRPPPTRESSPTARWRTRAAGRRGRCACSPTRPGWTASRSAG